MQRGLQRPVAHSDECRQRIIERRLEDRDLEGRANSETERMMKRDSEVDASKVPVRKPVSDVGDIEAMCSRDDDDNAEADAAFNAS